MLRSCLGEGILVPALYPLYSSPPSMAYAIRCGEPTSDHECDGENMVAPDSNDSDGEQVHDSILCRQLDTNCRRVMQHAEQCPVASTSKKRKYTGISDICVSSPPPVLTTVRSPQDTLSVAVALGGAHGCGHTSNIRTVTIRGKQESAGPLQTSTSDCQSESAASTLQH